jgi:phage shock protein A
MMMALLLAIGAYYGKNVDASVHSIAETQKVMEERIGERVRQLEVFRAQTETSRFTSNEAAALRRELDALIGSNEKRVTRVEDALLNIDKSLAALVKKLEVKP